MATGPFESADWYRAMTLRERLAVLPGKDTRGEQRVDLALGERATQRWRSQPPFASAAAFHQRLALDRMSEEDMRFVLGEEPEALRVRVGQTPGWLTELAHAFSHQALPEPPGLGATRRDEASGDFAALIEPLLHQARERVRAGAEGLLQRRPGLPIDPASVPTLLFPSLRQRLKTMLARTLVLELNVARLQGLLAGGTPRERFRDFVERLRRPDVALTLLREYPVLARQLTICVEQWVTCSLEFLQHLAADWEALRATFSPDSDPGSLAQVDAGAGDTHRRGRSVMMARFTSGLQVVYKPRSLALDVHFQELLHWVNTQGARAPFRTLKIVARESHGWVEWVEACGCDSAAEVQRFYHRQGGYLAILYALEGRDFHCENLLAAGEHPVLLDLEALFHPRLNGIDREDPNDPAATALNHSVMRVGLLPEHVWPEPESVGADLSGLGAHGGQLWPLAVGEYENAGTDEMRFTRKRIVMETPASQPSLNGTPIGVLDHVEELVTGFTEMYRLLLEKRDELIGAEGLLARFAEDEVRVLLRPTNSYVTVFQESFHPDVLRDALQRDRLFDRLWVDVAQLPHLTRVIAAEQQDLWQGDIPIFETRPGSRDLWTSSKERLPDFFEETSMIRVQRRLQCLSEHDLASQIWFTRATLATILENSDAAPKVLTQAAESKRIADRDRLLAAACAAGDRLEALALRHGRQASWVGLTLVADRNWAVLPLDAELYSGLPGVALFLAYLGAVTREQRYTNLAQAAWERVRSELQCNRSELVSIGAFRGWGGMIYALAHLGTLWERPDFLREAEEMVESLSGLIDQDDCHDLVDGAAGCVGGLLSLLRCASSERTRAAAVRCGDHLLACAQTMPQGIAWASTIGATHPLTGFAHGAAGIGWALLELAAVTGEDRFRKAALAAVTYERSVFVPEENNWPDFRVPVIAGVKHEDFEAGFGTSWCHGAPGIGLSRLSALRHLEDPALRDEVEAALRTTLAQGFNRNQSLCHGDLGNLELLLQASLTFDDAWHSQTYRRAASVLASIETEGWRCGNPLEVESPDLMTGLAGIGYELLRLAEPERVPSVLTLDPPSGAAIR